MKKWRESADRYSFVRVAYGLHASKKERLSDFRKILPLIVCRLWEANPRHYEGLDRWGDPDTGETRVTDEWGLYYFGTAAERMRDDATRMLTARERRCLAFFEASGRG